MKFKWLLLPLLALLFAACDDEVSYSDMKERETRAVKEFIRSEGINVISFNDFIKNDSTTDVENNEYVIIDDVYMQIVRNPKGVEGARQMRDGETLNVMARFVEYNISEADTILGNVFDSDNPDYMRVKLDHGSYSATFTNGYMAITYGSAVPTGWLTPLPYIYFTRRQSQTAKVRLIVPHTKGTSTASSYVYPCFYEITFIPENLYDTD
ncbi:MAG: DUF4827 domain-containing protein [Bacteroidaceae bacterium]|nr:DUF4827 domain-containing protein [Bacteroidaceae bacterium]MBQ4038206.1 DUF4827 domain-containing protein [Bacteroidaceae bacterium]